MSQRRDAKRYNARFGTDISVGQQQGPSWQINAATGQTCFTLCDWSAIVAARFKVSPQRIIIDNLGIFLTGLRQGYFGKLLRTDWSVGLMLLWGFFPIFIALAAMIVFLLVYPIWALAPLPSLYFIVLIASRYDQSLGLAYILHIAWAARRMARRDHRELEAHVESWIHQIKALPVDTEVVIVGHSIGAALAARLAAGSDRPVSLLTIGQSIPLVSLQKEAKFLRDQMQLIQKGTWINVSAKKDMLGCLAQDPSGGQADCITVNLKTAFGADQVEGLRWSGFKMHFLYFRANAHPAPWDWFRVLTSPLPVLDQFSGATRRSGRGERRILF